jgi:replicative DNA helicase
MSSNLTPTNERILLGKIIIDSDTIYQVEHIISPKSFKSKTHQDVYEACLRIKERGENIDVLTIHSELKIKNRESADYAISLTNIVNTGHCAEREAKKVQEEYIKRNLIKVGSDLTKQASDKAIDVGDVLSFAETELNKAQEGIYTESVKKAGDIMPKVLENIEITGRTGENLSYVKTGIATYDEFTEGLCKQDMIVLAARPAMGKTALVLKILLNIGLRGEPVVFFGLEMPNEQIIIRLLCILTGFSGDQFKRGKFTEDQWKVIYAAAKKIEAAPIFLDDTPGLTVPQLRAKATKLKKREGIVFAAIDYLQLMEGEEYSREQQIAVISRKIKEIAKELDIPIIALSQLNRSVETRGGDKRPQLSDLRESGAIEQDADMVLFIHRPEYYGIEHYDNGDETKGIAELIAAKHRNGGVGSIKLGFEASCVRFHDLLPFEEATEESTDSNKKDPLLDIETVDLKSNKDDLPF